MHTISIVVPVYNVSQYLDDCLASICAQEYLNFEVVCVNDGSTDGSLEILEKWAEKDSRIKVISQENIGLSGARNTGMRAATGDYVAFVDSDDKLKPDYLSYLIGKAESDQCDVIGCGYERFPQASLSHFVCQTNQVLSFHDMLATNQQLQSSNDLCFVWRYLIRRSVLVDNSIWFDESVKFGEDMIFMTDVMAHANRIMLLDDTLYLYRSDNTHSLMNNKRYNPNIEPSLSRVFAIKQEQIARYDLDRYTPYSWDLAVYTIKRYLPLLLANNQAREDDVEAGIIQILSLPMICKSFSQIGYKNVFDNWKEYVLYLAMKHRIIPIILKFWK